MFFLNFSVFEFFALLGTVGSVITALYLLDRRRRRRVVSTLQFWTSSATAQQARSRRHMQQPWSLLLQLLSVLLLLLAAAQLQWGHRPAAVRNHVVLLDTSVWSGARLPSGQRVIDEERRTAREFLGTLPAGDRALVIYTDALASPAGSLTADRSKWEAMLAAAPVNASALDLQAALRFSGNAQRWAGGTPGEVVYIGPAMASPAPSALPQNLRAVTIVPPRENVGFEAATVEHSDTSADEWRSLLTLRNDGTQAQTVQLAVGFGETNFAARSYRLQPGGRVTASYLFTTSRAGALHASITNGGVIEADDRVRVQLPEPTRLRVVAVTRRRELLSPLLSAIHGLSVTYVEPAQYRADLDSGLVVFDEFAPATPPRAPSLWLDPPRNGSPWPIDSVARNTTLSTWNSSLFGDTGLRTRDLRLAQAKVFQPSQRDTAIASVPDGPVIVAREPGASTTGRTVAIGFDVLTDAPRTDVTTPLLIASALNWLTPQVFRSSDFAAQKVGQVSLPLGALAVPGPFQVLDEANATIPYSISNGSLQFFVEHPQIVRVGSPSYRRAVSLTLPDVETAAWTPPPSVRQGLPPMSRASKILDLWQWLAVAGGVCLFLEWFFFGRRGRRFAARRTRAADSLPHRRADRSAEKKVDEHVSV